MRFTRDRRWEGTIHTFGASVAAFAALALATGSSLAVASSAEEVSVSDDASLNRYASQFRDVAYDEGSTWTNLCVTWGPGDPQAGAPLIESGDQILERIVAQYTRAVLDRGGWENPYVSDGHYAAGPLFATGIGG